MTLARTFEKDIFISYCHADNEDPMGEGWIELFHRILRVRLKQILGAREAHEEPVIWRDNRLLGNEEFAERLVDELQQVALVVSVLSASYVKSTWCKSEIETFCRAAAARGGLTVGSKTRIFKVLKDPVPREDHPLVLQGQIGYEFFTIDRDTQRPTQFTLTKGDETIARAKVVIDDLAYSIIDTLKAVDLASAALPPPALNGVARPAGPAAPAALAAPANCGTVYLAETHYELDDQRLQVRRALEARGVKVLPAGDLPLRNPAEFRQAVLEALALSDVAVHMIGARRSLVLPNESEDTVFVQNQLAAQRCGAGGLRRVIWLPSDLQVPADDPRQAEFVDTLRRDREAQKGAELLRGPLQGLITGIDDALKKQREAAARPQPVVATAAAAAPVGVYLVWHPDDSAEIEPLRQHLFECGFDLLEPLSDPEATEAEIAAAHKMNLVDCSAAIVCVGKARELWMKAMLSELHKAVGLREGTPLRARAVYLAPPPAGAFKQNLRLQSVMVLDGRAGFTPEVLQPFVDRLAG